MNTCVTQSQLGEWFGISPIAVGKVLIAHGLKQGAGATEVALLGGFAKEACTRTGVTFFVWDACKVCTILDDAIGGTRPTPFIDDLVAQVGEAIAEAEGHRAKGDDFLADMILENACEGVPTGLVGLIQGRLSHQNSQT